jgi:hypothetical protein
MSFVKKNIKKVTLLVKIYKESIFKKGIFLPMANKNLINN